MKQIFRVVSQTDRISIPSQKSDSGQTFKSTIVLQEIGGKHADTYAATLLGKSALCKFYSGEVVAVKLKFTAHEHNNQFYQDVIVEDIIKLK